MGRMVDSGERLPLTGRFARLRLRLKDPEWRRYGMTLLLGKMLGLAILLLAILSISMWLKSGHAYAETPATTQAAMPMTMPATTQAAAPLTGTDIISPLNTVWTLIAAFLVFGMQVGF